MHENNNWNRLAGSKGSLFSGGQKQRIAIARALIRKPVVLVMDEATSALDKEAEERVLGNINTLKCSQIIIAHRMSTIKSCDRIIVIKNGRLAEMGSFEELMEQNGEFARLVAGKKQQ
jgi:ABC-type multidrug transport system fused ATPase/permease subunit